MTLNLPPAVRQAVYLVLVLANAVVVPLSAAGKLDTVWPAVIVSVASALGFTLATAKVAPVATDPDYGLETVEPVTDPEDAEDIPAEDATGAVG